MQTQEIWKSIENMQSMEGYEVSNLGRVRSLDRYVRNRNGMRFAKGKLLTPRDNTRGYLFCNTLNGKFSYVHRLVAMAFIPNPEKKSQVNHKNAIKSDNRVENLEWATTGENMKHASLNNLLNPRNSLGEKNTNARLKEIDVINIRSLRKNIPVKDIAKMYSITIFHVYNICKGNHWKHLNNAATASI